MQQIKTDRAPLYLQVQQHLLNLISDGVYKPGQQLPSEVDLAAQMGISRPTLREALLHLEQEGFVVRKHGVGTFIANGYELRLDSGLERLESILALAARQGMWVHFKDLQVMEEEADAKLTERLHIPPGTLVTTVRRVITVDDTPVAYMLDIAPISILSPADVDETFEGSVLDLLKRKQDLQIAQAVADIVALNADPFLAKKLMIKPEQAILLLEETLFNEDGTPVEFSRNYFVPDFFRFHVVRR